MTTCCHSDWVLDSPLGEIKLSDLIGVTLQWLDYHGVQNVGDIRSKVLTRINHFKELTEGLESDFSVCRHFVMNSVFLWVPERLKQSFKQTFIDIY